QTVTSRRVFRLVSSLRRMAGSIDDLTMPARLLRFGYSLMTLCAASRSGLGHQSSLYSSTRLRPACLALYRASSARLDSALLSSPGCSMAMPQLKVQDRSCGCAG